MQGKKISQKDIQFARRLKRLRKQAGFTQEELAYKTNLSITFIGLLETAKRKPSFKTLQKISSAIGVKMKDLLPY